jgi:hypothetical protein
MRANMSATGARHFPNGYDATTSVPPTNGRTLCQTSPSSCLRRELPYRAVAVVSALLGGALGVAVRGEYYAANRCDLSLPPVKSYRSVSVQVPPDCVSLKILPCWLAERSAPQKQSCHRRRGYDPSSKYR